MITVKDCETLCDADPNWVHELACRECLALVPAYACAHEATVCANILAASHQNQHQVIRAGSDFRVAA